MLPLLMVAAAVSGLTFVTTVFCENLWSGAPESGTAAFKKVQLFTGNPGKEGKENKAVEAKNKAIGELGFVEAGRGRLNKAAIEWVEVSTEETYKFIGFYNNAEKFLGYIEFDEPIPVKVGDTFRVPKEKLVLKIP